MSAAYTPTLEVDRGNYIRATATYDDGEGSNKTANAVSRRVGDPPPVNSAPVFPSTEDGRREVAENSTDGTAVGAPVAATDLNAGDSNVNDPLAYSLTGTDAGSFTIDTGTGQIPAGVGRNPGLRGQADVPGHRAGHRRPGPERRRRPGRHRRYHHRYRQRDKRQRGAVVTGDDEPSYREGSNRAVATYTGVDPERDTLTWSVNNEPNSGSPAGPALLPLAAELRGPDLVLRNRHRH